jgi:hypothetical protein
VDDSEVWYPHIYVSGSLWQSAIKAKFAEFGCAFKHYSTKVDFDTNLALIAELIEARAETEPGDLSLAKHKTMFRLVLRIIHTLVLTSTMGGSASADLFLAAGSKAIDAGRVDWASLLASRLSNFAATVVAEKPVPGFSDTTVVGTNTSAAHSRALEDAAHWRTMALSALGRDGGNGTRQPSRGGKPQGHYNAGYHQNRGGRKGRR